MFKLRSTVVFVCFVLIFLFLGVYQKIREYSVGVGDRGIKTISFILDWTPNTNHTGLYVAKEKGFFETLGIDLEIKYATSDSSADLVITGKAPFAVCSQDYMAKKLEKGAEITAIAAIVEHNTAGIISKKLSGIENPKSLSGKKYGTYNDPFELEMLKTIVNSEGGDFENIEKVPNMDSNSIVSLENDLFDAAWIYYGWDGLIAEAGQIETNFFYLRDYVVEFDYYAPVIIANNDYLSANKKQARAIIQAIKKGYQYSMDHPEESAEILIKHAPELKGNREFIRTSQKYLSDKYASDKGKWGQFDAGRWNAFYQWAFVNKLINNPIKDKGFTNDYVR